MNIWILATLIFDSIRQIKNKLYTAEKQLITWFPVSFFYLTFN